MSWRKKLLTTIEDSKTIPALKIVFRSAQPADHKFIMQLQEKYPFIDDEYCQFLAITDGASLWVYELFGSGMSRIPAIEGIIHRWRTNTENLQVFPFAEDPDGNCIAMRKNGNIIQYSYKDELDSDCIILANSFSDFLGDVLMGKDFYSLFDIPATEIKNNEWLYYLDRKGWLN
ncbi:SMI1/KNR4 family protein [Bremerella cremea]|uniref:SMI1/KNR4 family protein n=1 Tax=Bremerella cremea TaxID=1031537 RepID=A0A368KQ72_9BACT|nr:SMI1/KNR4 family protein [Bremerella cremea]RCS44198.1 SMI1/KNR4 family protein [Bremerella cremea]